MKRNKKNIIAVILIILMCGLIFLTINYAKNHSSSMDFSNNEIGNQPPSKNEGEKNSNQQSENEEENTKTNEPPEKPENDATDKGSLEIPSESNTPPTLNKNNKIDTIYYVFLALESLILSSLIIYLIMSKMNKKTIKETFVNKDKILISILSITILTTTLTYLEGKLTENNHSQMNQTMDINNMSEKSATYSAKTEIKEDTTITSGEYSSSKSSENAILVSGDVEASLSHITVEKTGDSDGGDNTSFYGTNSAIIAKDGANLVLKNITVNTNATGANGVFSYGGNASTNNTSKDGTTITISDSKITTTKDNSGGIMTTGGGVMNASNLEINTSGTSSAAIRTDRGGGTVSVDKGTYTTTGKGSPTIYSTADVTAKNATLTATSSEGVVIEGKNSVILDNVVLNDTNNQLNGKSTTYKNIFLYQSMSGDADTGIATFKSSNSKITTNKGDTFYITNTKANITLENNTIVNDDTTGNFLRIQKDSWGNTGENGGEVNLTLQNQKVTGNIVVDSISALDLSLENTSSYEGKINSDNTAKEINLKIDKTSKIKLTGNSYVTSLNNEDTTNSNIDFNGYTLYVNGKAINKS